MPMPECFKEYVELVCQQIRWKKARPVIGQEIGSHLCDQLDVLIKSGMDEDTATLESIRQMGDAVEIGMKLDRVHRPKPQWSMLIAYFSDFSVLGKYPKMVFFSVMAISLAGLYLSPVISGLSFYA